MKTREIDRADLKGGGYAAQPDGDGPHPGVVVIHEAYGLNDNIKDITRRFAENGYAALAVDLFTDRNRAICMARYMTGMLIGSVERAGISDLKAALTHLAVTPGVDPQRIGAIGFCMGGGFALAWACTDDRLKAIAPFYAANPRPIDAVKRACPVVGSYPEKDFTARAGRALDQVLVTGGTGALGREVVRRLIDSGHRARILSRRPADGSDWVQGDLVTGAGLELAVKDVDAIVHAASDAAN